MFTVDPQDVHQQRRRAQRLVDDRSVRACGRKYKEKTGIGSASLPKPGEIRRLTEVQRALVGTKRPAFSDRGAGFVYLLGRDGLQKRKRDQFFHDALQLCFQARTQRFPEKTTRKCLWALSRRATGQGASDAALLEESATLPYQPGWQIGVEYRACRSSYKRKAFKGALADALLRPERAYESVVLAVLANMPAELDHLIGKFRNLF